MTRRRYICATSHPWQQTQRVGGEVGLVAVTGARAFVQQAARIVYLRHVMMMKMEYN